MKKPLLLFSLLLIAFSGFGQKKQKTIGILVAPNGYFDRFKEEINFSYSAGFVYDQFISRRFGINTGLLLETERYENYYGEVRVWDVDRWPLRTKHRTLYLEVPVNLTFCFNPEAKSGYKAFLFSGMMLNQQISRKSTLYYTDEILVIREKGYWQDLWSYGYMNLGFEVRKNLGTHYAAAIGTSAKFRPAHSLDFGSSERDPVLFNLNLKFGRNL